jgi:FkbH-like protein
MQPLRLIDALKILQVDSPPENRILRVYLACGFTPLHLKTFLAAYLQRACPDRRVQIDSGLYGDILGNIERARAEHGTVVIALEWPDIDGRLGIRAVGSTAGWEDLRDSACKKVERIKRAVERLLDGNIVALSLPSLPARTVIVHPGWKVSPLEAALFKCAADFTAWASEQKNLKVLNSHSLDEASPLNARWNIRSEIASGFPYQLGHASVLAELLSRLIRPPIPKKGLITDLDNTLWSGIVGDVGTEGISWSLDQRSHVHAIYQQYLSALANAGVLLAVASKNDPAIVQEAFKRADMLVESNRIFPMEVRWGPKSAGIRRILQAWNIASDSVVFIDDSPMEIAEVQSAFPDMECIAFPNDPDGITQLVSRLRDLFGKEFVSHEDFLRLDTIRSRWQATTPAPDTGLSLDDFLRDAESEITLTWSKNPADARPLELINKTNQFNLNGTRYSDAEWIGYLNDPNRRLLVVSYKDKYGQLGKISVLGIHAASDTEVVVDTWVMSCRAFSRRIEYRCLEQLFVITGKGEITFDFQLTSRNMPLQEFFAGLLGSPPTGRFKLPRSVFCEKCPPLFQTIKDV